jgi:hypothetical protein
MSVLKGGLTRAASMMFSSAVHRPKTVGDSLQFLPEAELPEDLLWAKPAVNVAGAFARFAKAVEIDAQYALPLEVRLHVQELINKAAAKKKKFDPSLIPQSVSEFSDEALKSATQLTLITAFAPYRIDEKIVASFRKHFPEDTKLLGALAWASFTMARKIGTQLSKS